MAKPIRKYSFDIDSARQRLDKMIRESNRLEATDDRVEKSDHAINAATDGWHLHEWVWAEVKEIERIDPLTIQHPSADTEEQLRLQLNAQQRKLGELRVEIGKEINVKPANVGKAHFGQFMAKRHPSIEMCRIIATGSKHLGVDELGNVEVETFVSANPSTSISLELNSRTEPVEVIYKGVPKIRYGDIVRGSSDVFREAEQVWTDLIYGYKIDR